LYKHSENDKPLYVISKDIVNNTITVSENIINNKINDKNFNLINTNWISHLPELNKNYTCQIRYHGELIGCHFMDIDGDKAEIKLEKPILISPGQSIVVYAKDVCLGGGVVIY
jgi:tRNA-specific 2-thiouridylase